MWIQNQSDELYHHGIQGMHWHHHSAARAENYSTAQRVRDRKIYGPGSERRINKRMLDGENIQSARHNEVNRKARIQNGKKIGKTVAKGALVVGGAAAVTAVLKKKGFGNGVVNVGRSIINSILR